MANPLIALLGAAAVPRAHQAVQAVRAAEVFRDLAQGFDKLEDKLARIEELERRVETLERRLADIADPPKRGTAKRSRATTSGT